MILEVRDLRKTFHQGGTEIEILRGVTLSLDKGETLAILGESGSGKSTLLSLLAGLDRPTSGTVAVQGQDLNALDEAGLARFRARHLGIVFQQFHLMAHLTAEENVALPLDIRRDPSAAAKAQQALERVGLAGRRTHLPSQLSGGECQRVAIARAMVSEPDVLLADEPSGNLDTRTGEQVMGLLFDLVTTRAITLILVTHNEKLARRCQRERVLDSGLLRE
jgi:putative ABC transport system ATP-binding protein